MTTVTLRDGTKAVIRPIEPEDKERLQAGLQLLSPQSRYLRFHSPIDHLTTEQLRYLTELDYHDHMAWVATNPAAPDEPGMGVARYVLLPDEPTVAEAAVTVLDKYQGLGLGTILLRKLQESAVDNGIKTLRNYVLASNRAMLEIFDEAGAERFHEGAGVYRVDVTLPSDTTDLVDTPAALLLRQSALGLLPTFHFPRLSRLRRR